MFLCNFGSIIVVLGVVFLDNIVIDIKVNDFVDFRDIFVVYDVKFSNLEWGC